jgi:membrane protease YdiL (CAAX protease family)
VFALNRKRTACAPHEVTGGAEPVTAADRQVVWFGLLAIGLTWSAWLPLVATSEGLADIHASPYLHFVGGLGPALAGIIMTATHDGRRGLRLMWLRITTGPGRWLIFAIAAPASAYLVAVGLAAAVGVHVDLRLTGASEEFSSLPVAVYWLANLVFYGFGEEIGWRGFALPRLQRRRSALAASMWLAVLWGLWHIPLFFFSAGLGTMPLVGLIGWAASIVTGSVLCTWLFNSTRGSIAVLAVFHAALDIFIGSPTGGDVVANVMGAFVVIGALTIPRRLGRENLSRSPKVTSTSTGAGPHGPEGSGSGAMSMLSGSTS